MATETAHIILKKNTKAAFLKLVRCGGVSNLAHIGLIAGPLGREDRRWLEKPPRTIFKMKD